MVFDWRYKIVRYQGKTLLKTAVTWPVVRARVLTLYAICCPHSLTTILTCTQPKVFGTMRSSFL